MRAWVCRVHSWVKVAEPWSVVFGWVALVVSLIAFSIDYSDRVEDRTIRAWQVLTTQAPGNSGKVAALEYLNKTGTPLIGIDLSPPCSEYAGFATPTLGAYLENVQLPGADLRLAVLYNAVLIRADLRGSDLRSAKFDYANLTYADLSGALLVNAHLGRAKLLGATLHGADLTGALGLTQGQLDEACGDGETTLPPGLTIKTCE